MRLICLNRIVPAMERAPHKIYMLEFEHTKGELCEFKFFPLEYLRQLPEFSDVNDKTTLNIIGVEGDKQGRDHSRIRSTHALVADLRPLGIYFLFWDKPETPEGFKRATTTGLLSQLVIAGRRKGQSRTKARTRPRGTVTRR